MATRQAREMAVYEATSEPVRYKYKTALCSKATIFVIISATCTVICPFLIAYRSNGFWIKTDQFREQPDVKFKHEYLLIVETDELFSPIICSTFPQLRHIMPQLRECSMVKSRESDYNKDGKNDELMIELSVPLENFENVHAIKLFLFFDYRLYKLTSLSMESMGFIDHSSSLPGARFDVSADLRLLQKTLLAAHGKNSELDKSIIDEEAILMGDLDLDKMLRRYASRSLSTRLRNVYPLWTAGRPNDKPFVVSATVYYPEDSIEYRPGFWQVAKWAWIQYLAVLLIVGTVTRKLTHYVFNRQLVQSVRETPWPNESAKVD